MEGVFAGTSAAVSEHIVEICACSNGFSRMVGDVSIAFLHVAEDEIVYILRAARAHSEVRAQDAQFRPVVAEGREVRQDRHLLRHELGGHGRQPEVDDKPEALPRPLSRLQLLPDPE
eukprot:13421508-Alexandrium_andersonii.AAC.1